MFHHNHQSPKAPPALRREIFDCKYTGVLYEKVRKKWFARLSDRLLRDRGRVCSWLCSCSIQVQRSTGAKVRKREEAQEIESIHNRLVPKHSKRDTASSSISPISETKSHRKTVSGLDWDTGTKSIAATTRAFVTEKRAEFLSLSRYAATKTITQTQPCLRR